MAVNGLRDTDAARLGERFQPCGNVHAIAIEIVALDHHVAEVHADAQCDPPVFGDRLVGRAHRLLKRHRGLDGIHGAGELHENAIAHQLDDTAMMLGNQRLKNFLASVFERSQGSGIIALYEAAVADNVGNENGGKPTFHCEAPPETRTPSC